MPFIHSFADGSLRRHIRVLSGFFYHVASHRRIHSTNMYHKPCFLASVAMRLQTWFHLFSSSSCFRDSFFSSAISNSVHVQCICTVDVNAYVAFELLRAACAFGCVTEKANVLVMSLYCSIVLRLLTVLSTLLTVTMGSVFKNNLVTSCAFMQRALIQPI